MFKNTGLGKMNEVVEVASVGVSIIKNALYLVKGFMTLPLMQKIAFIKYSGRMTRFILEGHDTYDDVIVEVEMSNFENSSEIKTEIRRETILKGKNLPHQIAMNMNGITEYVYILVNVDEGEKGLDFDSCMHILDGKGKVFSYLPMNVEEYKEYMEEVNQQ